MASLDEIVRYKQSLGFSNNRETVIMAQSDSSKSVLTGWFINAMVNSWYYISFEQTGLLFMKISMAYKLTGENKFIPLNSIRSLSFEPIKLSANWTTGKSRLSAIELKVVGTDGHEMTMAAQKFIPGRPWIKHNLQNVRHMLGDL